VNPTTRIVLPFGSKKRTAPGWAVPADGWRRLVSLLSEALNVKTNRIVPESRLYADLGMRYGLG
jgi:hypothetical protein